MRSVVKTSADVHFPSCWTIWRCKCLSASTLTFAGSPRATPAMPPFVTFQVWADHVIVCAWTAWDRQNRTPQIEIRKIDIRNGVIDIPAPALRERIGKFSRVLPGAGPKAFDPGVYRLYHSGRNIVSGYLTQHRS